MPINTPYKPIVAINPPYKPIVFEIFFGQKIKINGAKHVSINHMISISFLKKIFLSKNEDP